MPHRFAVLSSYIVVCVRLLTFVLVAELVL